MVQSAITDLLDAAEAKGRMEVMADFATPLPVLVIAQMMGVPAADRPYIRELAEKLLARRPGSPRPVADPDRRHAGACSSTCPRWSKSA